MKYVIALLVLCVMPSVASAQYIYWQRPYRRHFSPDIYNYNIQVQQPAPYQGGWDYPRPMYMPVQPEISLNSAMMLYERFSAEQDAQFWMHMYLIKQMYADD